MAIYDKELGEIAGARKRMAEFYRVALHCHSPQSSDWGTKKGVDKELNAKAKLLAEGGEREYLNRVMSQSEIDLLTVTDHMKCGYATRVDACARKTGGPVVLPGMEVNFTTSAVLANVRVHIIVILPGGCTGEIFGKLLPGLPEEGSRKDGDTITGQDLKEWIKRVHAEGGVCIAAHVESTNGIRMCFRQTAKSVMELLPIDDEEKKEQGRVIDGKLREILFDACFDAVEIKKPEDRHHYRWEQGDEGRRLATVLGLDAHCIEDFARKESITLAKMTEPGINGLRDALKFPEIRIRFACDIIEPPSPRILGVSVSGGKESFFENIVCAFSENLNCIIGARGSGKSTLVEAIRYVFGYNRTLGELDVTNKLSERVRGLQKATLGDCQIRVYYQLTDGRIRILEATYDPKQDYTTKVFDKEGKGVPVDDVERSGDYPLRLYGWSEIETLGRDRGRQRALLDRMIPDLTGVLQRREAIRDKLANNREQVRIKAADLAKTLGQNVGEVYRYAEYRRDFEELNKENVKKHFEKIDALEGKQKVVKAVVANITGFIKKVTELEPLSLTRGVQEMLNNLGEELNMWWQEWQIKDKEISETEQFIAGELGKVKQKLQQLQQNLTNKEGLIAKELASEYESLRNSLSGEPDLLRIADLRRNAKTRLQRVASVRGQYLEKWKELRDLLSARSTIAEALKRIQNEITGVRAAMIETVQERLNKFMGEKLNIQLKICPAGDKAEYYQKLEVLFRAKGHRINRRVQQFVSSEYNPVDFASLLLQRRWDELKGKHSVDGETIAIDEADVAWLKEIRDWVVDSKEADLKMLVDEGEQLLNTLALQEVGWEDEETILLNGRPVDQLSPGQRSSAMLPLIALAEESPLIIDQPEDNLDNRLVGHVLVDILAELKEHRQIIVCTHNPNIVVSGDAEQVVVLDAKTDRKGELSVAGSIDNEDIVQTVIDLMEGGKDAFRVRMERYGIKYGVRNEE